MSDDKRPQDFDWITARSECSIEGVFLKLARQAERDVKKFNELSKIASGKFQGDSGDWSFGVFRLGHGPAAYVSFERDHNAITVKQPRRANRTITMTLGDDGACKLQINGDGPQLDHWQVLRQLLEPILFGEPS